MPLPKLNSDNEVIAVSSVSDYLNKVIDNLNNKNIDNNSQNSLHREKVRNLYFRGESQKYEYRTPSLYREESLVINGSEIYYRKLMNELARDSYSDGAALFQILSEMQHYEAKTRMLDVTTNPLVALYFAAELNRDKDGYVFVYQAFDGEEKFDSGMTVGILTALNFVDPQNVRTFSLYMVGIYQYLKKMGKFTGHVSMLGKRVDDKANRLSIDEIFELLDKLVVSENPLKIDKFGQLITLYGVSNPNMKRQVEKQLKGLLGLGEEDVIDYSDRKTSDALIKVSRMSLHDLKNFIKEFMDKISRLTKNHVNYEYPILVAKDINKSHIILTSKNSDRLRQQQGAFIYPSYPTSKIKPSNLDKIKSEINDSIIKKSAKSLKTGKPLVFRVPGRLKSDILDELALIGINKGFIYADISSRSDSILNKNSL